MDTLEARAELLSRATTVFGPRDSLPRPAFVIFHGCGGVGSNLAIYANFVANLGLRVFVVDSYKARGWSRRWAARFACNGLAFRGHERSGDVLASLYMISQRADVDSDQIILAGWSHGAWAIMDLMTQKLKRRGEAKLSNPDPKWLSGIKGLMLMYPIVIFPARSVLRDWHYRPRTLMVWTLKDHLANYKLSLNMVRTLRGQGVPVETLTFDATHAFDEEGIDRFGFMKYDADALQSTLDALKDFVTSTVTLRR